ncbi:MAG: DNA-binding response regulator [Betaproteobacteria bacterium HGW-Betaproteobacteria-6]|nr:MAG: DNA-binding response regulator [Betaproteobacteria bacterium HGW-Betaproteobacteria-6]
MTVSLTSPPPIVYVVDDDASVRESLSSLIRSAGMAVEVFASPFEFLAKDQLSDFACLVLDVRMPGLDGLALQERIAELGVEIPIIFITGHGDVPLAVRAMKAGAIDFLNKPFDDTDLLDAISVALSRVSAAVNERSELADLCQRFDALTPREKQIMFAVAQGKQNKAIAYDLSVTESTVAELTLAIQQLKSVGKKAPAG